MTKDTTKIPSIHTYKKWTHHPKMDIVLKSEFRRSNAFSLSPKNKSLCRKLLKYEDDVDSRRNNNYPNNLPDYFRLDFGRNYKLWKSQQGKHLYYLDRLKVSNKLNFLTGMDTKRSKYKDSINNENWKSHRELIPIGNR